MFSCDKYLINKNFTIVYVCYHTVMHFFNKKIHSPIRVLKSVGPVAGLTVDCSSAALSKKNVENRHFVTSNCVLPNKIRSAHFNCDFRRKYITPRYTKRKHEMKTMIHAHAYL